MVSVRVEREIPASLDTVWNIISDIDNIGLVLNLSKLLTTMETSSKGR
jgi:hypothetical protein